MRLVNSRAVGKKFDIGPESLNGLIKRIVEGFVSNLGKLNKASSLSPCQKFDLTPWQRLAAFDFIIQTI